MRPLSKATDQVNGTVGIVIPRSLCRSRNCFKSPDSSPEETLSLEG